MRFAGQYGVKWGQNGSKMKFFGFFSKTALTISFFSQRKKILQCFINVPSYKSRKILVLQIWGKRLHFWIIGIQKLCKSIRQNCVECRKRFSKLCSQVMGKLPLERLKPSPPSSSTGIDLIGPYEIRGEVNKRSSGKAYGIIFVCLPTTAVYIVLILLMITLLMVFCL